MLKILPHCTLFYRVGHYNGFQKGFSFVSRLLFILLYLKLTLNWFIKVLQDFNQSSLSQRILLLVSYCCFAYTYFILLLSNAFTYTCSRLYRQTLLLHLLSSLLRDTLILVRHSYFTCDRSYFTCQTLLLHKDHFYLIHTQSQLDVCMCIYRYI